MELNTEMDCCFIKDDKRFRYRAAAIIIEDDCVLLASNEKSDYYYSIGGGVHLGESSQDAVIREVFEETGVHYEVDRLVFIHENFFAPKGSFEGLSCHGISFFYLMKPRGTQELNSDSYSSQGKESMNWIPISKLKDTKSFPRFFADKLTNLPSIVEHIVTDER